MRTTGPGNRRERSSPVMGFWSCLFVGAVLLLSSCAGTAAGTTVHSVIDGDTIEVTTSGRIETVRLLGIDTPETVHPQKPTECYGVEASALLKSLLPVGTEVVLTRDTEARDHFGRLLAYVARRADGLDINAHLIQSGAAHTLNIAPNSTFSGRYAALEREASTNRRGLWGACNA